MADDVPSDLPPPPDLWSAEDGGHLRALREAARVDRVQLARQCTLSTTQLQQLEEGGDSAFYSTAIKLAAGLRALDRLGGTRPHRTEQAGPATAIGTEPAAIADAVAPPALDISTVAVIPQPPAPGHAQPGPQPERAGPRPSPVGPKPARARTLQTVGLAAVLGAGLLTVAWQSARGPNEATSHDRASTQAQDERQAVTPAPMVSAKGALATSGTPSEAGVPATSGTKSDTSSGAATVNAALPAKRPLGSTGADCAAAPAPVVDATPSTADRAPDYVYLVAKDDVTICLRDATQAGKQLKLTAGKGLKVTGEPPFVLSGDGLADVDVYFQGHRIRAHQGGEAVALRLLPR